MPYVIKLIINVVKGLFSAGWDLSYNSSSGAFSFTNDAGDIEGVTAGDGLTGGGTSGTVTVTVVGGYGITANANDIELTNTNNEFENTETYNDIEKTETYNDIEKTIGKSNNNNNNNNNNLLNKLHKCKLHKNSLNSYSLVKNSLHTIELPTIGF